MAIGVMPTASATRRMDTPSAPSSSNRRRAAMAILRAVVTGNMYTLYTCREIPATVDQGRAFPLGPQGRRPCADTPRMDFKDRHGMSDQRRINLPLVEKDQIVVGQPLPFSIFSADGKLLLAAGRIVESDHARQILLNHGTRGGARSDNNMPPRAAYDTAEHPTVCPLTTFQNSYRRGNATHRFPLSMARNETAEAFRTWVIGVYDRIMVVAAPVRSNGALVAVIAGQAWLCRTFQATSAFRFHGTVLRVAFEPF